MQGRLAENPFYVLGLPPDASRAEVERQGQKLLALLEIGHSGAQRYDTPVGPRPRTPEAVRTALSALRDPARRLVHELGAQLPAAEVCELVDDEAFLEELAAPWPGARRALGWRGA